MSLLWLIIIPLVAGLVIYPLRKLPWIPALLSAATLVAVGLVATRLPEGQTMLVLGRTLVFQPLARYLFVLICGTLALLLLHGGGTSPGPLLYPLGLVIASALAAVILIRNLAISAVFLELALVLIALLIPNKRPLSAQSAMRYLVIMTLAVLPLLLIPWAADIYELNPGDTALPEFILVTILVGFAVLLGAVPFHAWLPPIAEYAPPAVTAMLVAPVNLTIWYRLLEALNRYPWVAVDPRLGTVLASLGMCTVVAGGVLAFAQRNLSRLMGYVALSDLGMILMATNSGIAMQQQAILLQWMIRSLAFALMAMSTGTLRRYLGDTGLETVRSTARRFPVTTIGLLASGLSLAGLPPTGGFTGRWIMVQSLLVQAPWQALALLGSSALIGWIYLRFLAEMLASPEELSGPREPLLRSFIIALTTLLLLVLTWYSRPILDLLPGLAQQLSALAPSG